jgi:hypothetical protein
MKAFYDVHIHSCLSPCSENDMTPNNIVNMSLLKELDIIAITDHNSLKNCEVAMTIAEDKNIIVIPGVEVQTIEEVHMVCLFRSIEDALAIDKILQKKLMKVKNKPEKFGQQYVMNAKDEVIESIENLLIVSVEMTISELIALVNLYNGVVFPAHIDREYASIITNLGFIPDEYSFRYIEVSKRDSAKKYLSDEKLKNKYFILRNSDAHNLGMINEPLYSLELEELTIDCFIDKLKKGSYMKELSLHILDIARNSIVAGADHIRIAIIEDTKKDELIIKIKDDGKGMDPETVKNVVDPFYTTRTTRKVGLGVPMFKANAEACDGSFDITSELGVGTELVAKFKHSHIDRVPLGNMADTIITIINGDDNIDLLYTHEMNGEKFILNTKDIRKRLGDVSITNIDVLIWLKSYISEGLEEIQNAV